MVIQIYAPPEPGLELRDLKMGDINDAISLEYELFFCGVGTFTLELPLTTPFAEQLYLNNLLYLRDDDVCFIIKNVKRTSDKITVVGYDLNGMLLDRLTMERDSGVEGTEGKDCISGTTEACVKHFVDYNMVNSADTFRNYARFAVAEDLGRGNADDSDLVGKEVVEDVVRTLCEGAELGYRVKLQLHDSETEPLLVFDIYEREDHTADQSERNRVIFSEGLQNITEIERETGITAEKNALWCDTGGENMFVYKNVDANGTALNPVGWDRREEYISLSVTDNYDTAEIEQTARKQMADKFAKTDSLVIDAGNPLDYGAVYKLGDIVTAYDKKRSIQLNSVISSVLVKRSSTEHSVQISLGERKPKLLDKYAKQSQIQRKEQTDFPPTEDTGGGDTIEQAVIIQQSDITHLLHEYTFIKYISGNKAVYGGPDSSIVVSGCIAQSGDAYETQPKYQNVSFSLAGSVGGSEAPSSVTIQTKLINANRAVNTNSPTGWSTRYRVEVFINGVSKTSLTVLGVGGLSHGLNIKWSYIYPPDHNENYPYGYVRCEVTAYAITVNAEGEGVKDSSGVATYYVGFDSLSEYRAAINLTYEPEYNDEVNENVTVVPNTDTSAAEILEIAYAYTDKALATHETQANSVHQDIYNTIGTLNSSINNNTAAIASNSAQINDINDVENGIYANAVKYTDTTAEQLRSEFGETS